MKKYWTMWGYLEEKDFNANNANARRIDIGTMLEDRCGLEIHITFEKVEFKLDEHFPIDDECSSNDDCSDSVDINDDINEEVYGEPTAKSSTTANNDSNMSIADMH